jgi:hypothetical protein
VCGRNVSTEHRGLTGGEGVASGATAPGDRVQGAAKWATECILNEKSASCAQRFKF